MHNQRHIYVCNFAIIRQLGFPSLLSAAETKWPNYYKLLVKYFTKQNDEIQNMDWNVMDYKSNNINNKRSSDNSSVLHNKQFKDLVIDSYHETIHYALIRPSCYH